MELCAKPGFPNGLIVTDEAYALFVDLDLRGLTLFANGDDKLRISRKVGTDLPDLSDEDRLQIRQWKQHLLALVGYCKEDH